MLQGLTFQNIFFLWGLLIIPLLIVLYIKKYSLQKPSITLSNTSIFIYDKKSGRVKYMHIPFILRLIVITLLIVALARPQKTSSKQDINIEGIDIIMSLDISGSMLAEDFKPNRLEAAKDVASEFIKNRPNDRVGLVVFSGETFTQCPLTSDHSVLINLFKDIKSGMIEDGTALGDGLATSINRLKNSKAISKVIILLTDGINNQGSMDPKSAADIAKLNGIRVYTIGVGSYGTAPYPVMTPFGKQYQNMEVQIDESLLKSIAKTTNGSYFRATSKNKLKGIYQEIDKLEKSKIDISEYSKRTEMFAPLALIAFLFLLIEVILRYTFFKTLP
ncbi:MAG: VWA domain-containing protein [Bacteroidota bacterium]